MKYPAKARRCFHHRPRFFPSVQGSFHSARGDHLCHPASAAACRHRARANLWQTPACAKLALLGRYDRRFGGFWPKIQKIPKNDDFRHFRSLDPRAKNKCRKRGSAPLLSANPHGMLRFEERIIAWGFGLRFSETSITPITVVRCVLQIAAFRRDSHKTSEKPNHRCTLRPSNRSITWGFAKRRSKTCTWARSKRGRTPEGFSPEVYSRCCVAVRGRFSSFSGRAECGMVFCPTLWCPLQTCTPPFDRNGFVACTSLRLFCGPRCCILLFPPRYDDGSEDGVPRWRPWLHFARCGLRKIFRLACTPPFWARPCAHFLARFRESPRYAAI